MANRRQSTQGVTSRLLARPRISLVTSRLDVEVDRLRAVLGDHLEVDGRSALERILGELIGADGERTAKTLDLIGHTTPDGLQQLGDWVLDGESPTVTAFFRGIADVEILPRLGVTSLRLLGSCTAVTTRGRATLQILSELLELEVLGTIGPIHRVHYDADGFREDARGMLAAGSEAPLAVVMDMPADRAHRRLDIDALPRVPIARPLRLVHGNTARELLSLIDRTRGAELPGLLALPGHELALMPEAGQCRIAHVILDGHFVRVYPAGAHEPGIVYPVHDPRQLLALALELPSA
ncbi:MAG: hypothetical protein H0T46_10770 [Deltaproteobacteria bacterium]|nr:hypothetical protein [Deltaproteobacteria bacterium]